MQLEDKIKLYIRGVSAGVSEQAGCNDGEANRSKAMIEEFFNLSDEKFKEYCANTLVRVVAYGG